MLVSVVVAAFVLSVLSLLVAGASALYTRQQARSTSGLHDIERRREHEALQPTFEVTLDVAESDRDIARPKLQIRLTGPVELGRLNNVSVKIRDDQVRGGSPLAGGPSGEEVAEYVWGPYRFRPGVDHADSLGRTAELGPLAVDEVHQLQLQRTQAPPWYSGGQAAWEEKYPTHADVRVTVVCTRDKYEPWEIPMTVALPFPLRAYLA